MAGEDFVHIRLTKVGAKLGAVGVHTSRLSYHFEPGKTYRVLRAFDWEQVLSQRQVEGEPMFELAPAKKEMTPAADVAEKKTEGEG